VHVHQEVDRGSHKTDGDREVVSGDDAAINNISPSFNVGLACNPMIQIERFEEVDSTIENHGGN